MYLTSLYAVLWRWLGLNWQVTLDIVAGFVALSFLVIYFCLRPFLHPIVSAGAALFFVANPFYISFTPLPRDSLKFPFFVSIAALIVAIAAAPRSPRGFFLFACLLGLSIGIGFGFRSDLLLFLVPALIVIVFVCRVEGASLKLSSWPRRLLANALFRGVAVAGFVLCFAIGGWMPVLNDFILHEHSGDVGYHPLAMGLQGHSRGDLFQREILNTGTYMYRNGYNSDLGVGVRVIEFGERRHGENTTYDDPLYRLNSKEYYWRIVSLIPADFISGAIGAFVNIMTDPYSFLYRQS
ncbi:MAG TPA: hypothetical protein VKB78_13845, partial [Pirellulales bacterium]|nr:hypothetical protein [Pirellulales bacterium]